MDQHELRPRVSAKGGERVVVVVVSSFASSSFSTSTVWILEAVALNKSLSQKWTLETGRRRAGGAHSLLSRAGRWEERHSSSSSSTTQPRQQAAAPPHLTSSLPHPIYSTVQGSSLFFLAEQGCQFGSFVKPALRRHFF